MCACLSVCVCKVHGYNSEVVAANSRSCLESNGYFSGSVSRRTNHHALLFQVRVESNFHLPNNIQNLISKLCVLRNGPACKLACKSSIMSYTHVFLLSFNTCKRLQKYFGSRQSTHAWNISLFCTYLVFSSYVLSPSLYVTVNWFVSDSLAKVQTTLLEAPTTTFAWLVRLLWQICIIINFSGNGSVISSYNNL